MIDAEQALRVAAQHDDERSAAEANVVLYYRGNPDLIPVALAAGTAEAASAIEVVVNHGRWIAECPSGDGGAQFASREDRRFMCLECLNADVGGLWRPVVWPDEVAEIETVLDERTQQANQNWLPGETVADLVDENAAHADDASSEVVE